MAITHDDLNAILGDIDDAKVIKILALTPTVAELEEAAIWATGYGLRRCSCQGGPAADRHRR